MKTLNTRKIRMLNEILEAISSAKHCHRTVMTGFVGGNCRDKKVTDIQWYRNMREIHLDTAKNIRAALKEL